MNRFLSITASAIGAAAILGGAGSIVLAQTGTPTPSATPSGTAQTAPGEKQAEWVTALAAKLGIDEAKLRDAIKAVNLDFLDKAVADGKLTAEQAAEIRTRIESGQGPIIGFGHGGPGGHRGGPGEGRGFGARVDVDAEVATFLGITEDQVHSELQSGKTLAQVAEAHGKTRDQLKTFLTGKLTAAIDQAVTDGKMTAEQATTAKAGIADRIDKMLDNTMGPKGDRPMNPGQRRGPNGQAPSSSGTN